jgi:hypothetical protein
MYSSVRLLVAMFVVVAASAAFTGQPQPAGEQRINLAEHLAGKLKASNYDVTKLPEPNAVHIAKPGSGNVIWIEGSDFRAGTLEVDVRGRDVFQQSFLGLAFHGRDDKTYEAVYLRPFNFRAEDPVRKQHAVQYISLPDFDWARLRKEFPEEFENPVDASLVPTDWVKLRLVVRDRDVQVYAGQVKTPTLEVRKLGQLQGGMVGLWGDGDFANLVITPAK